MRKAYGFALLTIAALSLHGCSGHQSADETSAPIAKTAAPPGTEPPDFHLAAAQRAVIRNGEITVRVDSVEKAERSVVKTVNAWQGFVSESKSSDLAGDHPTVAMTVRVPSNLFDKAMEEFQSLGVRLSQSVTAEDVTGQVLDMEQRLKTLRAQEQAYRRLLATSGSFGTTSQLEQKLANTRSAIESLAGENKELAGLANLCTIQVTLQQAAQTIAPTDPSWAKEGWASASNTFMGLVRGIALGSMWILAFSPVWLPLAFALRFVKKRVPFATAPRPPAA